MQECTSRPLFLYSQALPAKSPVILPLLPSRVADYCYIHTSERQAKSFRRPGDAARHRDRFALHRGVQIAAPPPLKRSMAFFNMFALAPWAVFAGENPQKRQRSAQTPVGR